MKKINKTWILILFLIVLTGLLLALSLYAENSTTEEENTPTITAQVEKEVAFTTLSISNEPRISTVSGRYEVDVVINTDENEVTLTQLELVYDPDVLIIYDIKPGNLIINPEEIQKNIDDDSGRISYWLGVGPKQKWIQGEGSIATISFAKIGTGSAQLDFSPKTSINANGIKDTVLKEAIPGFIELLPTPTPLPTRAIIPTQIPEAE